MSPIVLLQEKLKQRHLRAELARSKAITTAATRREVKMPLLDAIAEAARSTGRSGDEVLAEFVAGKASFPAIEAALASSRKPTAPAAAKATPVKPAAGTPAAKPTTATASPFAAAPTDHLVALIRRKYLTGADLAPARAELARRGVTIHRTGFSITH